MRRGTLLLKITFVLATTAIFATQHQALADDAQARHAIELLARSQTLDTKCKFLGAADHDDLSGLLARAELALAQRTTVTITKQTLEQGRNAGQSASCSGAEQAQIALILSSAKQAAAKAPVAAVPQQVVQASPTKPWRLLKKAPQIKVVINADEPTKLKVTQQKTVGLLQYANITERYYLARRCGTMSPRKISGFYQTVVNTHQSVLSIYGRAAVADVMQQSEYKAKAQSCD